MGDPDRSVWSAGAETILAWEPGPRFAEEASRSGIFEWEAFLSLDGGRTWAIRLTPHLSIAVRRIAVELPAVTARDARLLLRFGDEARELEAELPLRLRIDSSTRERRSPARRAWHVGEAARPGGEGALFWAEGGRGAEGIAQYEAASPEGFLRAALRCGPPARLAPARAPERDGRAEPASRAIPRAPERGWRRAAGPEAAELARSLLPLLATCRLNL